MPRTQPSAVMQAHRHLIAVTTATLFLLSGCSEPAAPVRVASVEIASGVRTLLIGPGGGQSVQLAATARSETGDVINGSRMVWSVQPAGVLSVSPTGLATAIGVGTAMVRATAGERSATATVMVQRVPVTAVKITSAPIALRRTPLVVGTTQVVAVAYDSTGAVLDNPALAWQSSDALVAAVDNVGRVAATGSGTAFVSASANGNRDSVAVTVTVDAALPDGVDVAVTGALWTQASQTAEGTIPLLLGGRAAVLNVMTSSPVAFVAPSVFELRLYGFDGALRWSARRSATIPSRSTTSESPTVQFLVPSVELGADLQWEVRWNPDGEITDADAATDRFPRDGRSAVATVHPPLLKLRFVPITLTAHGGMAGNVNDSNVTEYLRLIRQFGPLGGIAYSIAPAFSFAGSFGPAPTGGGSSFWISLLQQLDLARIASGEFADAHWVGVVRPPAGFNFATFGGFGYIPSNGASFGPGTRTFAVVNAGWFTRESGTRELMMHELGHNLGRRHAPCGGAPSPDPNFPDADGRSGGGAHDTYTFEQGFATSATAITADVSDVMGYCTPVWISTYNYDAMLQFRGAATLAIREPAVPQRAIVVHGIASAPDTVSLHRAVTVHAVASLHPDEGDWEAFVYDDLGLLLGRRRFLLGRMDHLDDAQRPISVAIPLAEGNATGLMRVEVRSPSGHISQVTVSPDAP